MSGDSENFQPLPAQSVNAGGLAPGANFVSPSEMPGRKHEAVKRGTQHWTCNVPALLTWMDFASSSSELISETGSLADSDIGMWTLILLDGNPQVIEVSVRDQSRRPPPLMQSGP